MEKNVRINKRNVKCWISRVILGSLTHAGMPAEASTVSIKPSVFGESLKIKDHGTLMWSSHFLRISNHRFKLWLHVHVQGNGDELKHRDIGDNLVQTNLARGRGHVKATYSLLRISSSNKNDNDKLLNVSSFQRAGCRSWWRSSLTRGSRHHLLTTNNDNDEDEWVFWVKNCSWNYSILGM